VNDLSALPDGNPLTGGDLELLTADVDRNGLDGHQRSFQHEARNQDKTQNLAHELERLVLHIVTPLKSFFHSRKTDRPIVPQNISLNYKKV